MKVILTGTTGFIGTEVLSQALSHPSITSLLVLSRRALPSPFPSDPKLRVVILEDFMNIPDHVMRDLEGCEGCIWALGTTSQDPKISRRVNVDYTLSAASSFSQLPHPAGTKFRFVYCSGIAAVRDQEKKLWFLSEGRKIRGQVETRLLDLSKKYRQSFDPIIVRPAMVLSKESGILRSIMALAPSVKVDELAAAMVEAAVSGSATQTVENERLRLRGRKLLDERVTE